VILVISYADEDHALDVIQRLRAAGREVVLVDLADFPAQRGMVFAWDGKQSPSFVIDGPVGPIDLRRVDVCWWRRVRPFTVDASIVAPSRRAFAESETAQAINGILDSLSCAWVNDRAADEAAHHKPYQWSVAQEVGLRVPRTLVTTQPDAARRFIDEVGIGRTVFKAFLAILEAYRETRLVVKEDVDRLDLVRLAPVIFQEYIEGVDLRISVVGERVFAAEIDAQATSYPVDMRMVIGEAAIRPVALPGSVHAQILALQRRLDLSYGAIDMRRTPSGDHYFLEVNPAGQWLFVEQRTGMPISQAMADYLMGLEDTRRERSIS